jgi:hypothetical protein
MKIITIILRSRIGDGFRSFPTRNSVSMLNRTYVAAWNKRDCKLGERLSVRWENYTCLEHLNQKHLDAIFVSFKTLDVRSNFWLCRTRPINASERTFSLASDAASKRVRNALGSITKITWAIHRLFPLPSLCFSSCSPHQCTSCSFVNSFSTKIISSILNFLTIFTLIIGKSR